MCNTAYHSLVDLEYLDPQTIVGRNQMREILSEGFEVPPEVVVWFFEVLASQYREIAKLQGQLSFYEEQEEQKEQKWNRYIM